MKKILSLILVASVLFTVSVSAQGPKDKMALAKQTLVDSLKIPEASADSVMAITARTMGQVKTIMNDQSLSQEQKKDKIKPLKEDMKTQLKKYLTDDQMAKLKEIQAERRQNKNSE